MSEEKLEKRLVDKYFDLWEKHGFRGSMRENCKRLGVAPRTVQQWQDGEKSPKLAYFLRELRKLGYTLDIVSLKQKRD